MLKIYFDTEFTGLHKNTTLISIGIVTEANQFFYAELNDYDESQIDQWLEDNILSHLLFKDEPNALKETPDGIYMKGSSIEVREAIEKWALSITPNGEQLEVWSDTLSFDWILFNHLWGTAFDLPPMFYYIPMDLATALRLKGLDPDISREELVDGFIKLPDLEPAVLAKHNALWDAFIIKACLEALQVS
jgi:hypothetical protein